MFFILYLQILGKHVFKQERNVKESQVELSVCCLLSVVCDFVESWGAYAPKNEDNLKIEDILRHENDAKNEHGLSSITLPGISKMTPNRK